MAKKKYIESTERWKKIPNFIGYEVSDKGNINSYKIRNSKKLSAIPKRLKQSIVKTHCKEYKRVFLMQNGKRHSLYVHRIVAKTFLDNPYNKPQVNHIDNNGLNNNLLNLEWVTNSENQKHRFGGKRKVCKDRNYFRVFFKKEGKRKSKNFKSKKEAEEFINELECIEK